MSGQWAIHSIFPYPGDGGKEEDGNTASAELSLHWCIFHWCIFHSYRSSGISELETAFGMLHLTGTDNLSILK